MYSCFMLLNVVVLASGFLPNFLFPTACPLYPYSCQATVENNWFSFTVIFFNYLIFSNVCIDGKEYGIQSSQTCTCRLNLPPHFFISVATNISPSPLVYPSSNISIDEGKYDLDICCFCWVIISRDIQEWGHCMLAMTNAWELLFTCLSGHLYWWFCFRLLAWLNFIAIQFLVLPSKYPQGFCMQVHWRESAFA